MMKATLHMPRWTLIAACAFLGGALSQLALHSHLVRSAAAGAYDGTDDHQTFHDQNGRLRLNLGVLDGQPVEEMYGEDGKLRIQVGTYPAAPGVVLPVLTLFDNSGRPKLTLTVNGANQSPTIVMRDNNGKDRLVFGLSPTDPSEDPFLATYDKAGAKTLVFGSN